MNEISVLKIGGNEIDDPEWISAFVEAVSCAEGPKVIVHGGGKEVTAIQRSLGAEPQWRDGLRITTPEMLSSVRMVLSGMINKRLVGSLMARGVRAVGVSGEDGGLIRATPVLGGALGATGTPEAVQPRLLRALLEAGFVPVVSPVSMGPDGGALNVNADEAAAAVAVGVGAAALLFVSNVPGVLSDGIAMAEVAYDEIDALVGNGVAVGGMIPKLRAAGHAASGGVGNVRIGNLDMLAGAAGTLVVGTSGALQEVR